MAKVTITLQGRVSYFARRTFELDVSEGENLQMLNLHVFEGIADRLQVPWEFDNEGYVETTDFTIHH